MISFEEEEKSTCLQILPHTILQIIINKTIFWVILKELRYVILDCIDLKPLWVVNYTLLFIICFYTYLLHP